MSVKAQIKGYVYKVSEPYTVGNNGTEKQDLILKQPARRNEFGEVKGKDEYFKLEIIGKKVAELNLNNSIAGALAECNVWFRSNYWQKEGNYGFIIGAGLESIQLIGGNPTPAAAAPALVPTPVAASSDDLPF